MSNRDKEKVILICQDCKKYFELSYGRYRRFPKDHYWRCKECNNIQRSIRYVNLTEEERKNLTKQRSESAKKVWKDLSDDEYIRRCKSQQERWAKLSHEEKLIIMKNTLSAAAEYNRRPETKSKLAQRNIDNWKNMSIQDKIKELQRLNKIRDDAWNKLTDEEKFLKMKKMWDSNSWIGPTEYLFNDTIKDIGLIIGNHYFWGYSSYPYIHPEYYNIFGKINPLTLETNFPYHTWDFILYPKSDNPILIDIDGSAHNVHNMGFKRYGNKYTEREKIDYNDSQRPYQIPDGMSAYIIEAYYDKIEDNTPVVNVITNNRSTYKDLIKIITDRFNPDDLSDNRQTFIDYRTTTAFVDIRCKCS